MRKQIYKAICARIAEKLPEIKHINLWNNNLAYLTGGALFPRPAVFVEFETIDWQQSLKRVRQADIGVRLHIITDAVLSYGSTDPKEDNALEFFDLIDRLNAALQNLNGENFSAFMLTTSATNHDHAELIESVERFITRAQDTSAIDKNFQLSQVENLKISR